MNYDTFLNFAYGSNMPTLRMRERCPSAQSIGVAELTGYKLRWHKPSTDKSGKCDVVLSSDPSCMVYGVLYEIANLERKTLNESEGGYTGTYIEVRVNGCLKAAIVYIANRHDATLLPYNWYKELVILGALEHRLPQNYVAEIERVTSIEDPKVERHQEKDALVERIRVDVHAKLEAMLG